MSPNPVSRLALLAALFLAGCSRAGGAGETPTKEIVERALQSTWERKADSFQPKVTLTLNAVKFGAPSRATAQQVQVEGFPAGATVTPALVDFTVRTFYDRETQALRRVREAAVYKDKFGAWAVQTGSAQGQDVTTMEPAGGK